MSLDISEMMDGELDEHGALRALAALRESEQARQAWEQYHVIGDALRGTAARTDSAQLQQRVFTALANEPTVLAPQRKRAAPARWLRYSMAAAATVAAFGLFTWFSPRGQQAAQVASQSAPARSVNSLDAAAGADDPYLEAHFEVSPTIRPSILRANWRPSDER